MHLKAFFQKTAILFLAIFSLFIGFFVYATIDRTIVVSEQLVVIPDTVSSDTWTNINNSLISDVSEQSLYQNFSKENSAYIDLNAINSQSVENLIENEKSDSIDNLPVGNDSTEDEIVDVSDVDVEANPDIEIVPEEDTSPVNEEVIKVIEDIVNASDESESEVESVEESVPEVVEEISETVPSESAFKSNNLFWGLLPNASNTNFPLAQEVITTYLTTSTDLDTIPEEIQPENELEVVEENVVEQISDNEIELNESLDSEVNSEEGTEPIEESELPITETEVTETEDTQVIDEEALSDLEPVEELVSEPEAEVISIEDVCAGDIECKMYSSVFSGFAMPEFESGNFLTSAQLRLSLAAKTLSDNYSGPQRFVIEYRYAENTPWLTATTIDIEDEISNSINGGYYLVSLERPSHQSQLSLLQVRVSYQGNISNLERAFVESLWLEVTSSKFFEETDPAYLDEAIDYSRDLKSPEFLELNSPDIDQNFNHLPSFTLSYSPQQNFFKRVFKEIFSENQYKVEQVRLTDINGEVIQVPIKIVYHDDTTWTLKFEKQPQKLMAGKYTLEVLVNENDVIFTDSFEFYWGVLAVNPLKSMYTPNESVELHMAALTDKGDTICDAALTLKIIDPEQSVYEVPVEQSGACGKNNVTDIPDYIASFNDTDLVGKYVIQLHHYNQSGSLVHMIEDSFDVRPFVMFDVERKAPTRIYPLAPYDVEIKVTANTDYVGDITEVVPRGFIFEDTGGALVISKPDVTELVWKDVSLKEGETITLKYRFDAPDISPYIYLLGPLQIDTFRELRLWQIASDALSGVGWFTGTRTVGSTNLNNAFSPMQWSTSSIDAYYFTHSTTTDNHEITLRQSGDYLLNVNVPMIRTDGTNSRSRVGVEVRLNGVAIPAGLGRSGYIRNANSHNESSSNANFLLSEVDPDDVLEVYIGGVSVIETSDIVNVSGQAGLYLEYIGSSKTIFAATATSTTNSANLNQATAYALMWTETRQDTGFSHSDATNPENITISDPGTYLVHISIPLTNSTANHQAVLGRVRLDGTQVPGGVFAQGYARALEDTDSDEESTIHWTGVVTSTTSNQILSVTTELEAAAGTSTVTTGFVGSIYVEKMSSTDTVVLRGTTLASGSDWSPAAVTAINFNNQVLIDSATYGHSTTSNSQNILVKEAGNYLLTFNAPFNVAANHANTRVTVSVNSVEVSGASTKSNYIRNQSAHSNSSSQLVYLLENLASSSTINIRVQEEGANATLALTSDVIVTLTQKQVSNERPTEPTLFSAPFDNIRFASTTPFFEFESVDPDGTSDLVYEFQLATSSDFSGGIIRYSSSSAGFSNTASTTDTSPFREDDKIRFQLQSGDALSDLETYYWRTRALDVSGSGENGDWSVTQSLTVNLAASAPSWYQSFNGQFEGNSFVGTLSSGDDQVQVDAAVSTELLAVYAEGTVTTPRYRIWNGSSWGVEGNAIAVTNTINWVETAASVSRSEYALVTLDQSNDAFAQIYQASTSSWGNQTLLSSELTSSAYRGIGVAYESLSGDLMAISCTNGPDPVYRIWNGSSWSATSTINASSLNNCNYIQVASDPSSDEIIVVVRDTGTQYEALVWDGSAWVSNRIIGTPASVASEGVDIAYESSGDQALITVANGTNASFFYTTWTGTEFTTNTTQTIGNDLIYAKLSPDPDSEAIALCYIDADSDVGSIIWDGAVWLIPTTELTTTGNAITGRPVDCEFETLAGRSGNIIAPYGDTGVDGDYHATYSTTTSSWTSNQTGSNLNDSLWVQTERAGDGLVMALHYDDENDRLDSTYWNGSSWTAGATLEAALPAAGVYEAMSMSAKRFQFVEGTVQTPFINFNFVPNQATWGDVSFSTIEPFGTDVKLRIKYTSTTTCDTYIPNGSLTGNSAGFDVTQSPIDLTTLSTTTYSQICLEATLNTLGTDSAVLEDWTLAWVREPRPVQQAYQWYVNGSFLTPTDAWPVGSVDLAENTRIDSTYAVSNDETLRLRMSLRGANVDLATSTEQFKLQFAPGFTCTPGLNWADVGDPASTTAIWRGYENSIVDSDWYSANWGRRIEITVNEALVAEDLTNFPIYVDLADLPSGFFDFVQNDGDDIRVTTSDGISEVPFELVSINTGLETGELHFKATLSSTTDSLFYIYYGNSGASGYAASATYGARNVWTNSYSLRYALDDSPAGSSPQFLDSSSNSNDSVAYAGMTSGDVVAGKIGQAIALDGDDGGTFESALAYTGTFTASMWWQTQVITDGDGFAIAGPAGANEKFGSWTANTMFIRAITSSDTAVTAPANDTWAHVVLTRDSSNKVDLHINGTTTRLFGDVAQAGTSDWINFGGETTQGFEGLLDELRFSSVRRSNGWISTEYNNQSNPTGFYAVSAEELIGDGRLLPSTLLLESDFAETYEEENPTRDNQKALVVGSDSEWDFVLQNNGASANTNYCFRLVYSDGAALNTYTNYPRLITNSPPVIPVNVAPFDNEQLASTRPEFEFYADDELNDLISYEIQVDDNFNFSSPIITRNSVDHFSLFTNLSNISERSQYSSGQVVQFIPDSDLSNGVTYWFRVRGRDDFGSNTFSDWSTPTSVTVSTSTTITTWMQTTGEQFGTNTLVDAINSTSTNDIGIDSGFTVATVTSSVIDYDNRDTGNSWGEFSFTNNVTSGSIRYYIEYKDSGTFALVPDAVLTGNSSGFTSSPVSLTNLDTSIYNEIRIRAVLSGNSTLPRLQLWTVTWSETTTVPEPVTLFDNAKTSTTSPAFTFFSIDPENQDIEYELQLSTSSEFVSSSTFSSGVDAGFSNSASSSDVSPFVSGDTIRYQVQTSLTNGTTYWWRLRARDPSPGSNAWTQYSEPRSFTVDTSITTSVWYQTTGEQFNTNTLEDIDTTSGSALITSTVDEVMVAYGEGTGQAPRDRIWNGTAWDTAQTAASVGAQVRTVRLKASPSRSEYALGTTGTDNDVNFQIYDGDTGTWSNVTELYDNVSNAERRAFDIAYESDSGDLLAVSCAGTDAVYSIWNGTTWTATSSINLVNTNNCEWVLMASDPTSDEIIAVFRHTVAAGVDYEAMVWTGSAWTATTTFGQLVEAESEGMALAYEESGDQAVLAISTTTSVQASSLYFYTWNGIAWSTPSSTSLGDHLEFATLQPDSGTDRLALCYVDNDNNSGFTIWNGSAWDAFVEVEPVTANGNNARPIDCAFETDSARDGDLVVTYSDNATLSYFQTFDTALSGESALSTMPDGYEISMVRGGDGRIHTVAYDDGATGNDDILASDWSGSWSALTTISTYSAQDANAEFTNGFSLAPRTYPVFVDGSILSTAVDFNDGDGPRWERATFSDLTPGSSDILYRVYYRASTTAFVIVPDSALPGNSLGFSSSPINISVLDTSTYNELKLQAELICVGGNCPTLNDWSVEWSEGITVSGSALEFDGLSTTTSGTVAVAVNGELQVGKTGTISATGTWSISNVNAFVDDTITVFVEGASDSDEAVGVTTYDGTGNVTGMELIKRHLTIGSNDVATTTNASFTGYDNTDDEDIFFTVGVGNILTVCAEVTCGDGRLKILSGSVYQPGANIVTHDFSNFGSFRPATNTVRVSGSWNQQGTFVEDTSTVFFTATSGTETLSATGTQNIFYNLTFGETSGSSTWNMTKPIDISGTLGIDFGTLARGTSSINVEQGIRIGASGFMTGIGTTTFDGTGSHTWGDSKSIASSTNLGYVVVDGIAKTITLSGNVGAQSILIGTDDTLNSSGSGYNINVVSGWTNNNAFIPQSGTVTFVGTSTAVINRGSSSFNNISFTGIDGNWSFSTTTLVLTGNLSIATGTVTLPTGTTTIAGSFTNTGGTFLHNNGEVRMTSTSAGRTITQSGTAFLNAFYDLVFTGSGSWTFNEANATTSRNFRITAGNVTLSSSTLTVGGDYLVTGTGAFSHNNGEVILLVQDSDDVRTNGSSFNNLRTVGAVSSSWYNDAWNYRIPIVIQESQVDGDLTNFPVYVNLDDLSSSFFTNVKADGGDIRITQSDGVTELPREVVSIDTGGTTGEIYFRANSISSSTNSTFYLYYGNSLASDYASTTTYGARNVWSNGYVLVSHMGDLTTASVLNSAGTTNGIKTSANNPLVSTIGKVYSAQDISGDSVQYTASLLTNTNQYSVSMWFNPDALTGGNADEQNFGRSLYGISAAGSPYQWLRVGGTANATNLTLCAYDAGTVCNVSTGAGLATGNWYHVSVNAIKSATTTLRVNGNERLSFTNTGSGNVSDNFTIGDLRSGRLINFDGKIDEVRVASTTRSDAWIDAEYRNFATSTTFYTAGGAESSRARNFADTNTTVLGNFTLEIGGDAVFPSGTLSIAGSFNNDAEFNSNSGTVRFNSTGGAETIAVGSSTFATLEFNSATGDFTVTENATATVAINLTSVQQFTLQSGRILSTLGTFSNTATGANTTWTGSTLRLLNGTTTNMNLKTHGGDFYGTLEAASSTLAKMWNSSSTSYITSGASGAIYSQDHSGVDGELYIFGNYLRTTGTEYWSANTDFDGVTLSASSSRQVDVRVSTSSSVGLVNSSLNLVGTSTASTTIDSQTGSFGLNATNTTITAEYFTVAGTNENGFGLYASSTLSTFRDGFFNVVPGRTAITFSSSTINQNPSAQFFRIGFATTSAGSATNVTLVGTTTNFVWFRDGSGNLYGEAFDGIDGNPGSIRFDDSSNAIVVSGVVYSDDGITPQGSPTCNGTTPNVRIVVNGGTYTASTTCAAGTGAYSFPAVNYIGDPKMVVYLDTNGGVQGSVVTKTPTTDITNMHIYANRVITRHQDVLPLTASDMQTFDYDDDTDLRFIAGTTSLNLLPNTELYVFASTTFAPGGNITLQGNGSSTSYEGTLQIGPNATFTATGTETHTLGGRFVMATTSTFNSASSTFVFNATTTGKSITSPNTVTFNQIQFNGLGGGWNITAPLIVQADMYVATGTVTGTSNITLTNGSVYGNGVLSLGSGTTTINRSNTLGGTSAWTFNNLVLGNGTIVGTTTPNTSATTTILGRLTIANAHFLDAGSSIWDLAGTGTVFTETGTLLEDTSTIRFSGSGANVPSTNYYDLQLNAGAGLATYTGIGSGILVLNNLIIGGQSTSTFTVNTTDQVLEVRGDVLILNNGILEASNSADLTVLDDWNNDGVFNGNLGTVKFSGTGSSDISAGTSNFANVEIDGTGTYTVIENATSTNAWSLINHSSFVVASGTTLSVGGNFLNNIAGASTVWTGSTLYLFGTGTYEINDSSTNEVYETLSVGSGTHIRMWNSEASSYNVSSNGSLYSQDHEGVNGNLYIYGQLIRTLGNDYWSYGTDFDGTDLSGGNERIANIYFASGTSAIYNGASLYVIGTTTGTTTIQNQGSGTYGITIGTGATTEWNRVRIRNISADGIVFSGAPIVNNFSNTDHLVEINSGTAVTVGGTVINANEAKSFTGNIFNDDISVTGAVNVTATGTSVSSWRFTNHYGDIAGEDFDNDPNGNPGYITWDNSASLITVSGVVYQEDGVTLSSVCDGVTNNIRLVVAASTTDTTFNTSCSVASSSYSITNVGYSVFDELVVYIVGETEKATTITTEPISSINNLHLYENSVIVRHESTNPLTIQRMSYWDSSDDATNIQFTAVDDTTDTLTIPANRKLVIWSNKTFEPNGNVTVSGGGAGADYDGTLEAQTNAVFRAKTTEAHSIGGSVLFGTGAVFTSASSTLSLTTTGSGRTFDVNANSLHNLSVTGVGSYNFTDSTLTLGGSYTQSNGSVTFGTGTTTISSAFNVTSGTFNSNGSPFVFNGSGAGNTVRFNNSTVSSLRFSGSGSWNMTDTNATSTGSVLITSGGLTLPSGNFAVGGDFVKRAGTITHNTSDIIMTATTTASFNASSSDLYSVNFVGSGAFTITDPNITFLDSFTIASGSVVMATGTTAVGGSFMATGGTFNHSSGTVLLNSSSAGRTVNPGSNSFYNLQIGAPTGGYTLYTATTTNNFTISSVNILTVNPFSTIAVGGVFSNTVGGVATTWTNSTLFLNGQNSYTVNSRLNTGDTYGTLVVGQNSDIEMWYSDSATTTVDYGSSLYSQDNGNINGDLYIYGDLTIATTTEYWSYATDFDGTSLTGIERQVDVRFAPNSTTTVTTGSLQIIGSSTLETTIQNQATGTYSLSIAGGTLNANHYEFRNLDINGLQISGISTITNLENGYYDLAVNTGSLITLSSTTLNANPSKIFDNIGFSATSGISGYNINLVGETSNAWRITNNYGNIGGEGFDIDGIDACGSIRFNDSSCLLTEQTHARWRADDGEEGAPDTEWFDQSFTYRNSVRILNNDNQTYSSTSVKVALTYDSAMNSDFSDLRFTTTDGQTEVPFWVEKYTASTDAIVWVRVPTLPASDYANLYFYYGSSTASSFSSSTATFNVVDDYEDNNISEYSGDTSLFTTAVSPVFGGSYSLVAANTSGKTTDGIFRFDDTVSQGELIRYRQYINTSGGAGDETCTLFGVQSPGTTNNNYAVCLELFGTDRISLVKDVDNNDSSGTMLSSSTVTYSTGWYEVEIDWQTSDRIDVSLYNSSNALVATTSATDSSYTSGGYGYAFWFQNGAWDNFTSNPRIDTRPTVYLGAKQTAGGASWISALDASGSAIPNDVVRLRIAIENSGLGVTAQQYRLEYAAKGVAPTCESVDGGTYLQVPNQASCGSSPICMQTSSYVSNADITTDLLFGTNGTFSTGEIVTSPSSETTALDIDQDYYTELEYALTPTVNASDAYCFRVTNTGTELDFYAEVAELGLQFDPAFGAVTLNNNQPINLTPGTTTSVTVLGTITDYNGYTDLLNATATIYRSGNPFGPACTSDDNYCYVATTENSQCTFISCAGDSCDLSCTVDVYFHADPTDSGSAFDGQEWLAYAEVNDYSDGYDFASASGVILNSLRALNVDSAINYGALAADSDTGSFNPTTTVTNLGNSPISVDIEGTPLTDGLSSSIPADKQKVATSTFTYNACGGYCLQLSTSSAVTLGLNLAKPSTSTTPVDTEVYWGIEVPFTASNALHTGTNIFTAISAD